MIGPNPYKTFMILQNVMYVTCCKTIQNSISLKLKILILRSYWVNPNRHQ